MSKLKVDIVFKWNKYGKVVATLAVLFRLPIPNWCSTVTIDGNKI